MAIRVGIYGYGNLGRGVEAALTRCPDMELCGVFTRRDPSSLKIKTANVPVIAADKAAEYTDRIDVMILCGGSATDLPEQTPAMAALFNVVDSFDTHARIPAHFAAVDAASRAAGKVGAISVGWDPGMFSLNRLYAGAILPEGKDYTFWGKGVSQGHSDAVRRIEGVIDARQYTVPIDAAVEAVRSGAQPELSTREKHTREVFVVADENADRERITHEIVTMPHYFDQYDTTVHFITAEEMARDHSGLPHGGCVLRSGVSGDGNRQLIEYRLTLESNPEFTAGVLVAYARAVYRLNQEGKCGCVTVLDVPPAYCGDRSGEDLRAALL